MIEVILNRVLVKPFELETEHKFEGGGSLLVAHGKDEARHKAARVEGKVVSIGSTAYKDLVDESPIREGDHVVFARYSGVFVNDPETDETYVVLIDSDILCRVVRKGE